MIRILALLLSTLVLAGLAAPSAQAAGLPVIISATVDYTQKTVTISGQNFGSSPTVTLDSMTFPTMTAASKQIVADFPNRTPRSCFTPGRYFLTITFRNPVIDDFCGRHRCERTPRSAGRGGTCGAARIARRARLDRCGRAHGTARTHRSHRRCRCNGSNGSDRGCRCGRS